MLAELALSECCGKVLSAVKMSSYPCSQAVLVFDDGTFATLGINQYNGAWIENQTDIVESKLDVLGFGDRDLIESGIISKEELRQIRESKEQGRKARNEQREREHLIELMNKYKDELNDSYFSAHLEK